MDLLSSKDYVLVIDEVIEVCNEVHIGTKDINMLIDTKKMNVLKNGKVVWLDNDYNEQFSYFKRMVQNQNVYYDKNKKMMLWLLDGEAFDYFSDVIVLTYLFDGSRLKAYFDLYNKRYDYYWMPPKSSELIEGKFDDAEWKKKSRELINIYTGSLNDVGKQYSALSKTWYKRANKESKEKHKKLKCNLYNYFRNIINSKSDHNMYSVFGNYKEKYVNDRCRKGFVACNTRATNKYRDISTLAYCVNIYENPMIYGWFLDRGIELNQDVYALSTIIQWIWRSAIRDGNPINLYVPSRRMRDLLEQFLND